MSAFSAWLQQLRFDALLEPLLIAAASLLCITVHESSHGLAAWLLGDDTARRAGRISLNPLRHVDLVGLVMLCVFRFGWAKPVPVDGRRLRYGRGGMALTAAAGPASNVLLALLALAGLYPCLYALLFRESTFLTYFSLFLQYVVLISAGLAVFNLLPIPPLDGSKVLYPLLGDRASFFLARYERYGFLILAALLLTGLLDRPLGLLRGGLLQALDWTLIPYRNLLETLFR